MPPAIHKKWGRPKQRYDVRYSTLLRHQNRFYVGEERKTISDPGRGGQGRNSGIRKEACGKYELEKSQLEVQSEKEERIWLQRTSTTEALGAPSTVGVALFRALWNYRCLLIWRGWLRWWGLWRLLLLFLLLLQVSEGLMVVGLDIVQELLGDSTS